MSRLAFYILVPFIAVAVGCGKEQSPEVRTDVPSAPVAEPTVSEAPPTKDVVPPPPTVGERSFPLKSLGKSAVKVGKVTIPVWVMDTDPKRQEGMMFLTPKDVKPNEGMLFVFPQAMPQAFWMENTVLPLDIAFIGPDGKVLNVQKGKPFDQTALPSDGAAQFVLEMRLGEATKRGVKAGAKVDIPWNLRTTE